MDQRLKTQLDGLLRRKSPRSRLRDAEMRKSVGDKEFYRRVADAHADRRIVIGFGLAFVVILGILFLFMA